MWNEYDKCSTNVSVEYPKNDWQKQKTKSVKTKSQNKIKSLNSLVSKRNFT